MNRNTPRSGLTFCTIVSTNALAQARTLAGTLRVHHPDASLFVLLLDRPDGVIRPAAEAFTLLCLENLAGVDSPRHRFLAPPAELRGAVKPAWLLHLFENYGIRKLVYCPADLLLVKSVRRLEALLDRYPIIQGPDLTDDDEPTNRDSEPPALLALARGATAAAFLDGWKQRVEHGDVSPLAGVEPSWREVLPGSLRRLSIAAAGPYTWTTFDNGVVITDLMRRCYRQLDANAAATFGDPFVTTGRSFFAWLTSFGDSNLPPLLQAVYDERPDVRFHFPDVAGKDRNAFLHWMVTMGVRDYRFEPALLAAVAAPRAPAAVAAASAASITAGCYCPVSEPFGVNVLGLLQSEKGVGEHCRATARSLAAARIPMALNNYVDPGSANVDTSHTTFSTDNPYPINLVHINAVETPGLARAIPWYFKGRYNIGYWNWELEWFPEDWRGSFQFFDEIWAPSTFSQQSYQRRSPIPVHWLPIAVALPPCPRPRTVRRDRFGLARDAFVFLFAFDFHSLFARKNPLAAIEAFRRAFPRRRDVVLALKLHHGESAPLEFAEVVNACRGQANIRLFREVLCRDEMVGLLRLCDAYVGLHRSEGYGLPLVEAMALGKPVIATNYSGNVDFMNDSNSLPVRYRLVKLEQDYGPYRRGAVWAEPDVNHAAEQMRRVVEQPQFVAALAARARADVARTLSPQAVGERMRQRLLAVVQERTAVNDARFAARLAA